MQTLERHPHPEKRQERPETWSKTCRMLGSWPSGWPSRRVHRRGRSSRGSLSSFLFLLNQKKLKIGQNWF